MGYHKTASTWFQMIGYPSSANIKLLNHPSTPYYRIFMDEFVMPDRFNFCREDFIERFWQPQNENRSLENNHTLKGICEENLSGHFWSGRNSDTLISRIEECFDSPKIIISIREQRSMLGSLYSNYIKNGGHLGIKKLLNDVLIEGSLVQDKLSYDRLILDAIDRFGGDSVYVYPYEQFSNNPNLVLNDIYRFIGLEQIADINLKKINRARGYFTLHLDRMINTLGLTNKYSSFILDYLSIIDKTLPSVDHLISEDTMMLWRESNNKTRISTGINLSSYGYVCDKED